MSAQPDQFGNYRPIRELGSGGMGRVWLAERSDGEFLQRVALKVLKRGMDSDEILRRFRLERQILAGLSHPNIARLLDGGVSANGQSYFVMEFVDGQTLDQYCATHRPALPQRLQLFLAICDAVQYAHQRLLIHRDIKPANILVTADGVPKLLDFGIAKVLDQAEGSLAAAHTQAGQPLLTPQYSSPEQIQGGAITTATDVYGLGLLLYELLADQPAFVQGAGETAALLNSVVRTLPTPPSQRVSASGSSGADARRHRQLRGDLDNIVMMALRKEPERRYQTAEQFANDVRRFINAEPVQARRSTLAYRLGRFVRRNAIAVTAATVTALSLVAGIASTLQANRTAQQERTHAEERLLQVRALANKLIFDYHDAIQYLPGSTAVRAQLMQDAASYLDQLARDSTGDRQLQAELATAYSRISSILGAGDFRATTQDSSAAMRFNDKAVALLEQLAARADAQPQFAFQLGNALSEGGQMLLSMGRLTDSLGYFRRALDAYRRVGGLDSEGDIYRLELTRACLRLESALYGAFVRPVSVDRREAERLLMEADNLYAEMQRRNPANPQLPHFSEWLFRQHRIFLLHEGRLDEALAYHGRVGSVLEKLVESEPLNTAYRDDLAHSRLVDAELRWRHSNPAEAQRLAALGVAELSRLAAADPANKAMAAKVLGAQRVLGIVQLADHPGAGIRLLREAANDGLALLRGSRTDGVLMSRTGSILHDLAAALADQGRSAEAAAAIDQAIAVWDDLQRLDAANAGATHLAAESLLLEASIKRRIDPAAARRALERSALLWQRLERTGHLRGADRNKPAQLARLLDGVPAPP